MPIYGYTVPDLPTILRICFDGDVSPTVVAKKQPIRVNETMTLVLNQSQVDIKHPFDLDAPNWRCSHQKRRSSIL